jgi:hypothetical protein
LKGYKMLDHALLLKHYLRQRHTRIEITADNLWLELPGKTTEVLLYGAMASTFLEVNTYASHHADEPTETRLILCPKITMVIKAVEDEPEEEPAPPPASTPSDLPDDNELPVQDVTEKETRH